MPLLRKLNHCFRSPADLLLDEFNETHPLSESQQFEKDKHDAIMHKRDHKQTAIGDKRWDDF